MKLRLLCLMLFLPAVLTAQQLNREGLSRDALTTLADRFAKGSFEEFRELLSLPNDAHFPEDIERNVLM